MTKKTPVHISVCVCLCVVPRALWFDTLSTVDFKGDNVIVILDDMYKAGLETKDSHSFQRADTKKMCFAGQLVSQKIRN
jgi:hypothetical protein